MEIGMLSFSVIGPAGAGQARPAITRLPRDRGSAMVDMPHTFPVFDSTEMPSNFTTRLKLPAVTVSTDETKKRRGARTVEG